MVGKRELDRGDMLSLSSDRVRGNGPDGFVDGKREAGISSLLFHRHAALIKGVFHDVSPEEIEQLETVLKKFGRACRELAEKRVHF